MDLCRKVPSEYQPEQIISPSCSNLGSLDDLFSGHTTEEDENLEWLSIFVEDCLSSTGNCLPPPPPPPLPQPQNLENTTTNPKPSKPLQLVKSQKSPSPLEKFVIPGKARSKRKRRWGPLTSWSHHFKQIATSDPPLLQQAYWLADSELILPKKEDTGRRESRRDFEEEEEEEGEEREEEVNNNVNGNGMMGSSLEGQPRRCTHCLAQRTPQWRGGPLGPKTLCNACGVRYKSGRLLPEYRPAKSPTFVTYKHSNSHKKVLEMRSLLSSTS